MRRRGLLGLGAACMLLASGAAAAQDLPVDLELVLAIDVSQSVDFFEGRMQREGYVRAFSDPRIAQAIANGQYGRIAVTYIEWGGAGLWWQTVGWQVLASAADAQAFAARLDREPIMRLQGTSISSVLNYAAGQFTANRVNGTRRVIDISGDGPNSTGANVAEVRDHVVALGITINGVAINDRELTNYSLTDLDVYYEECVIGGPGAFVIAADGFEAFADAILRKLILEIADQQPTGRERFSPAGIQRAQFIGPLQKAPKKYAPACDVGERLRQLDQRGLPPEFLFR